MAWYAGSENFEKMLVLGMGCARSRQAWVSLRYDKNKLSWAWESDLKVCIPDLVLYETRQDKSGEHFSNCRDPDMTYYVNIGNTTKISCGLHIIKLEFCKAWTCPSMDIAQTLVDVYWTFHSISMSKALKQNQKFTSWAYKFVSTFWFKHGHSLKFEHRLAPPLVCRKSKQDNFEWTQKLYDTKKMESGFTWKPQAAEINAFGLGNDSKTIKHYDSRKYKFFEVDLNPMSKHW